MDCPLAMEVRAWASGPKKCLDGRQGRPAEQAGRSDGQLIGALRVLLEIRCDRFSRYPSGDGRLAGVNGDF